VLIVECLNAIYEMMVAAMLCYKKFVKSLTKQGFKINPYDGCVANKIVKGKQITICFHVDNCKISHEYSKVVDEMIKWLQAEYESIFKDGSGVMKVHRGKVYKYLGMSLDFSHKGRGCTGEFPARRTKKNLFGSTYATKIVRTSRANLAFSPPPPSPIFLNTMFDKSSPVATFPHRPYHKLPALAT
jgi:hypothetical protein